MSVVFGLCYFLGLVPLLWLGWLYANGQDRAAAWWWLAGAFGVSFLADTAALLLVNPWVSSLVYPVSQSAIVALVLLPHRPAGEFVGLVGMVGLAAALLGGAQGPDVMLRTVAWLGLVVIVWPRRDLGRLRAALLFAFGLGWLAWIVYMLNPGWPSWLAYQGIRAMSLGYFCSAATRAAPILRRA